MNDTQSDTQYSISDAKNDTHENEVGGQEIPKVDRKSEQKTLNGGQETPKVDRKGGQEIKMIPRMTPKMTPKIKVNVLKIQYTLLWKRKIRMTRHEIRPKFLFL